jgi:hypothetical protein
MTTTFARLYIETKILVQSKYMKQPMWLKPALRNEPMKIPFRITSRRDNTKPKDMIFPEDYLRDKFLKMNPEYTVKPYPIFGIFGKNVWYKNAVDLFAQRQYFVMCKGYSESEAYQIARAEWRKREETFELEARMAGQKSLARGESSTWKNPQGKRRGRNMAKTVETLRELDKEFTRDQL